jgi:hypothetical protein
MKSLENFIINEIQKLSNKDGFNFVLKEEEKKKSDNKSRETVKEENFIELEKVDPKEFKEEAKEAKNISEELGRMKQLLSFNNPLLKK